MPVDHAMLADVDPVLEAELVRHLPLRALAETHGVGVVPLRGVIQ